MPLEFKPIHQDKQQAYGNRLAECPQTASDYSFINLWGWAEAHGLFWAWDNDLVWIKQTRPRTVYWAPVGTWQGIDWPKRMSEIIDDPVRFVRVPDQLKGIWESTLGSRIEVKASRADWDYIYAVSDLMALKGNRFHKKKNLVNQFKKKYRYTYKTLGPDLVEQAAAMQSDWCTWRDCESHDTLSSENKVIEKILRSWDRLPDLTGGALLEDNTMVAYTVAERMSPDTVLIHFEKANQDYKGAYQAINQMFVENECADLSWVNREQDLGDEGLRKAKLSYHPVHFVEKYQVYVTSEPF